MMWDLFDDEPEEGQHRAPAGWWGVAGWAVGWILVWLVMMLALTDWPLLVDVWRMATGALEPVRP